MLGGITSSRQFSVKLFKNKSNEKTDKVFLKGKRLGFFLLDSYKILKNIIRRGSITVQHKAAEVSKSYFTCIPNGFTCVAM